MPPMLTATVVCHTYKVRAVQQKQCDHLKASSKALPYADNPALSATCVGKHTAMQASIWMSMDECMDELSTLRHIGRRPKQRSSGNNR